MKSSRFLFASGSNAYGQLATGSQEDSHEFVPCIFSGTAIGHLPPNTETIVQIASGANHTLVLTERTSHASSRPKRELWGCGDGRKGQLGRRSEICTPVLRPLDLHLDEHGLGAFEIRLVAASWETSFLALSQTGSNDILVSMGADDFGDLGIGSHQENNIRTEQKQFHVVDLSRVIRGNQLKINSMVAGPHHVVLGLQATVDDGSVVKLLVGWGISRHGQLGLEFRSASFMLSPRILSTEEDILSFALGNQHTVLLHDSGHCSGMGSDRKRQIRGISTLRNVRVVDCTWNGTYVVVEGCEGLQLLSNGSNMKGQLGRSFDEQEQSDFLAVDLPEKGARLRHIACGSEHILAVLTDSETNDGEVWGWGWNEHGNLGIGRTEDVHTPMKIWPPRSQVDQVSSYGTAVDIWAGCGTSWILVE